MAQATTAPARQTTLHLTVELKQPLTKGELQSFERECERLLARYPVRSMLLSCETNKA